MLSGAGLVKEEDTNVHVHATSSAVMSAAGVIDLTEALASFGSLTGDNAISIDAGTDAPLFIMLTEADGSITGDIITGSVAYASGKLTVTTPKINGETAVSAATNVLVDYYVIKKSETVSEIQITAQDFAGYYYVEADTLFRSQADGKDMPANLTFPNVKLQSGFTIALSGTGDPSTFDFTMDAFPGYTYFDKNKKVMCVIQVVEDSSAAAVDRHTVMPSNSANEYAGTTLDPLYEDSVNA